MNYCVSLTCLCRVCCFPNVGVLAWDLSDHHHSLDKALSKLHNICVLLSYTGAVGALYGPLHGGANEAVLRMLERIGHTDNIPKFIEGVKNRKEKMFGFGHRSVCTITAHCQVMHPHCTPPSHASAVKNGAHTHASNRHGMWLYLLACNRNQWLTKQCIHIQFQLQVTSSHDSSALIFEHLMILV